MGRQSQECKLYGILDGNLFHAEPDFSVLSLYAYRLCDSVPAYILYDIFPLLVSGGKQIHRPLMEDRTLILKAFSSDVLNW